MLFQSSRISIVFLLSKSHRPKPPAPALDRAPRSFELYSTLCSRTKLSRLTRGAYCVFLISREGTLRLRTHTETLATAFLEPHSQAAVTPAPQLL